MPGERAPQDILDYIKKSGAALAALRARVEALAGVEAPRFVGVGDNPPFQNSWENFDVPGPNARNLFFYKDRGRVYIEGVVKSGSSNTVVFQLPEDCRPFHQTNNPVAILIQAAGGIAVLAVTVDGLVRIANVSGADVSTFSLVSGVNFRCAA